jgi:hypothetical protein
VVTRDEALGLVEAFKAEGGGIAEDSVATAEEFVQWLYDQGYSLVSMEEAMTDSEEVVGTEEEPDISFDL